MEEPPIVSAFFGLPGRTYSAYAALLTAHGHDTLETPVSLIRILAPGEPHLPPAPYRTKSIYLVERHAATVADAAFTADEDIASALGREHQVVLDLPVGCAAHEALRPRLDAAILAVGPSPLDEHAAQDAIRNGALQTSSERAQAKGWRAQEARSTRPVRLLGCGRNGGRPAASAFARTLETELAMSVVLPMPTREDAVATFEGRPRPDTLDIAAALVMALQRPDARSEELEARLSEHRGKIARDRRSMPDRLRELADGLDAIQQGLRPTPEDLADAPLLEQWARVPKILPALAGAVYGHPDFPDGHLITTSDLYASDNVSYARVLSRFYRLGTPAGEEPVRPN